MIEQAELTIPRTPPSSNDREALDFDGHTVNLKTRMGPGKLKASWQAAVIAELEKLDLPRPLPHAGPGPVRVLITIRFAVRRKQERENYRSFISKAVGDALIGGHPDYSSGETREDRALVCRPWIVNDTDDDWELSFAINREKPPLDHEPSETTVRLFWREAAEEPST